MKILVVEDDKMTGNYVAEGLREEGHTVDLMTDGKDALLQASTTSYDILIVDRMLPGLDGVSVVKTMRGTKNQTPVLFLTSLGGVDDRIEGLNAGGDDYLVKPFAFGELSARVAALARRPRGTQDEIVLRAGDLEMDLVRRKVTRAGQPIDLLPSGFRPAQCYWKQCGTSALILRPTLSKPTSAVYVRRSINHMKWS